MSLRILAYLQLLIPFLKGPLVSWIDPDSGVALMSLSTLCSIALFVPLFSLKRWGILFFAAVTLTTLSLDIEALIESNWESNSVGLWWALGLDIVNGFGAGYWLYRVTKAAFFQRNLRWWWEGSPRFRMRFPVKVFWKDEQRDVHFLDISNGGALVDLGKTRRLVQGDSLIVEWSFFNLHYRLRAEVVHHLNDAGNFCGIEFWIPDRKTRKELSRLTRALELLRVEYRPTRPGVTRAIWNPTTPEALRLGPPPPPLKADPDNPPLGQGKNKKTA